MMATLRRAPKEDEDAAASIAGAPAATPRRGIPMVLVFPLVVGVSFATASLGYSVVGEVTKGELARVSRSQERWEEIALLAGWRIFELALGWFGKLDSLDVAMMGLLSHGPSIYLLVTFFNLNLTTAIGALLVDVVSASVPFLLLRPLTAMHRSSGHGNQRNRDLVDAPLRLLTTGLATSIYTVTLVLSLRYALPGALVVHFRGLPSVEPAYAASYAATLPATLAFGAAASSFIFAPFATTGATRDDEALRRFDPVRATLGQTLWWNAWGYTTRTKVVVRRTVAAALVTGINTFLSCKMTIPGVESAGAAAYAAVWALATLCTGVALGFVGSV